MGMKGKLTVAFVGAWCIRIFRVFMQLLSPRFIFVASTYPKEIRTLGSVATERDLLACLRLGSAVLLCLFLHIPSRT